MDSGDPASGSSSEESIDFCGRLKLWCRRFTDYIFSCFRDLLSFRFTLPDGSSITEPWLHPGDPNRSLNYSPTSRDALILGQKEMKPVVYIGLCSLTNDDGSDPPWLSVNVESILRERCCTYAFMSDGAFKSRLLARGLGFQSSPSAALQVAIVLPYVFSPTVVAAATRLVPRLDIIGDALKTNTNNGQPDDFTTQERIFAEMQSAMIDNDIAADLSNKYKPAVHIEFLAGGVLRPVYFCIDSANLNEESVGTLFEQSLELALAMMRPIETLAAARQKHVDDARRIREQQDHEYKESLRLDREKEVQARAAEQAQIEKIEKEKERLGLRRERAMGLMRNAVDRSVADAAEYGNIAVRIQNIRVVFKVHKSIKLEELEEVTKLADEILSEADRFEHIVISRNTAGDVGVVVEKGNERHKRTDLEFLLARAVMSDQPLML